MQFTLMTVIHAIDEQINWMNKSPQALPVWTVDLPLACSEMFFPFVYYQCPVTASVPSFWEVPSLC